MSLIYRFYFFLTNIFFENLEEKSFFLQKYPYDLKFFRTFDIFVIKLFLPSTYFNFFRVNYRTLYKFCKNSFLLGYYYFYKHVQYWILPIMLACVVFYFSLYIRSILFFKLVFEWFIIFNLFYWLISGFVFFTKKYQYNRFTSAISRFWRRSFILFWLVESSLFVVFIYLLLNASQEPVFAFDLIQLTKFRLYSWKFFIYKAFFVVLIILWSQLLLVQLKFNKSFMHNNILMLITIVLTYIVWLEFYQFFYTINWYGEVVWIFDLDDKIWYAESIFKRARIVNHYMTICVIAKFWHIIYIYIFWLFFLLRVLEKNKISYTFLSVNLQNFIILYLMNWILMYPWLKYIFRKFLTYNHKSFYEFRTFIISGFFNDFVLFYSNFFSHVNFFKKFKTPFFYSTNVNYGVHSFQKEFISAQLIEFILCINIKCFYLFIFSYLYILDILLCILKLYTIFIFYHFFFFLILKSVYIFMFEKFGMIEIEILILYLEKYNICIERRVFQVYPMFFEVTVFSLTIIICIMSLDIFLFLLTILGFFEFSWVC